MAQEWSITIKPPFEGLSPRWYRDSDSTYGSATQFNDLVDVDLSNPSAITQGPAFVSLTIVNSYDSNNYETIVQIIDRNVNSDTTYGISASYIWSITATTATAIHEIPAGGTGISIEEFDGVIYYMYNTADYSDIGTWNLLTTWDDTWGSTTAIASSNTFVKSDYHPMHNNGTNLIIGNDQYLGIWNGVYLAMNEADYKAGSIVKDIKDNIYNTYVAVDRLGDSVINIYSSDFAAVDDTGTPVTFGPDDSVKLGGYIGALYTRNGVLFATYKDETDDGVSIGYLSGSQIKALQFIKGSLPKYTQVTWFKGFLTLASDSNIYQAGQSELSESFLLSILASSSTASAIATPFSNLIITNTTSIYKNTGYSTSAKTTSLVFIPSDIHNLGIIKDIVVRTNALETGAGCKIKFLVNGEAESAARYITVNDIGESMHKFPNEDINNIETFKVIEDWSIGSSTNRCDIREITITGQTKEV